MDFVAKHCILARCGGEAFQEASQIGPIVFDKTRTLTQGSEPKVTDVIIHVFPYGTTTRMGGSALLVVFGIVHYETLA